VKQNEQAKQEKTLENVMVESDENARMGRRECLGNARLDLYGGDISMLISCQV